MEEFIRAVGVLGKRKGVATLGTVKELNGLTCVVNRKHLPELLDVRLQAIDKDSDTKILIVPKKDSKVLCLEVEGMPEETTIVKYSEIERLEIKIGGAEHIIGSNGKFTIKNENADLKEVLASAFDTICNATITTPSGAGFLSPNDKQSLITLKQDTLKLFE